MDFHTRAAEMERVTSELTAVVAVAVLVLLFLLTMLAKRGAEHGIGTVRRRLKALIVRRRFHQHDTQRGFEPLLPPRE